MNFGEVVWLGFGALILTWVLLTFCLRPLPSIKELIDELLSSWIGRMILLAGWAELGWHLFCQRP